MPFRLYYRGPLKANGSPKAKHSIRLKFHPQLIKLWKQERMIEFEDYLKKDNNFNILYTGMERDYACLINERLKLYSELDILFLRTSEPGQIITNGGDIDNRLKTLFDALRRPQSNDEFPKNEQLVETPNPCHCVLSDDALISRVSVTTDTLLDAENNDEVVLIITVNTAKKATVLGQYDI